MLFPAGCPQCYCGKIRQIITFLINFSCPKCYHRPDHSIPIFKYNRKIIPKPKNICFYRYLQYLLKSSKVRSGRVRSGLVWLGLAYVTLRYVRSVQFRLVQVRSGQTRPGQVRKLLF
jgi:hypothetical protein